MPTSWIRALLFVAVLIVGMGIVRSASAQAPFCDPRAATSLAPPPFTAIPDVRWEAAPWLTWCEELQAARSLETKPPREQISPQEQAPGQDVAAPRLAPYIPRRNAAVRVPVDRVRIAGPPGFRARVYRPPR